MPGKVGSERLLAPLLAADTKLEAAGKALTNGFVHMWVLHFAPLKGFNDLSKGPDLVVLQVSSYFKVDLEQHSSLHLDTWTHQLADQTSNYCSLAYRANAESKCHFWTPSIKARELLMELNHMIQAKCNITQNKAGTEYMSPAAYTEALHCDLLACINQSQTQNKQTPARVLNMAYAQGR
ncbi:hypothetical protein MMC29_000508 [Sticta canariensis]|nr:hypothetical protein [Sticta canariensis]